MNIFWLDRDIAKSAAYACDQHIVKMITEHSQQMCTALAQLGFYTAPMRPTHEKHPCVLWVRRDFANFVYLYCLNDAYFNEFRLRYQHPQHAGYWLTRDYVRNTTLRSIRQAYGRIGCDNSDALIADLIDDPVSYITTPPMAIPEELKRPLVGNKRQKLATVIAAYRQYYVEHKARFARYKTGQLPPFMRQV